MAILGPHGDGVEGKAQHVGGRNGPEERVGIRQGMGDRIDLAIEVTSLPYDGIGIAGRSHIRGLVQARQEGEEVASVGFGSCDVEQVDHGVAIPSCLFSGGEAPRKVLSAKRAVDCSGRFG